MGRQSLESRDSHLCSAIPRCCLTATLTLRLNVVIEQSLIGTVIKVQQHAAVGLAVGDGVSVVSCHKRVRQDAARLIQAIVGFWAAVTLEKIPCRSKHVWLRTMRRGRYIYRGRRVLQATPSTAALLGLCYSVVHCHNVISHHHPISISQG